MPIPRTSVSAHLLAALMLTIAPAGCGGGSKKDGASGGKADGKTPVANDGKAGDAKTPVADGAAGGSSGPGTGGPGSDGGAPAESSGAPANGSTAAGSGGGTGGGTGAPVAQTTGGGETGDAATGTTGGGVDTKALFKELKRKRTKDARATEIIAELEAAEVETIDIAKALTTRAKALFSSPERAKALYELALEKDPKYPNPAFELAKQAAMQGELDEAKTWLKEVRKRKGKKLLQQIDFDPMWEILKDDPEVRALLK